MADLRKVMILDAMSQDGMLILTDAPASYVKQWIKNYNQELEDGKNSYFDHFKKDHYVKVLYDSNDDPVENAEAIGWNEIYNLYNENE